MKNMIKKSLQILGIGIGVVLLVVIGYVAFVFGTYHRIEDYQELAIIVPEMENLSTTIEGEGETTVSKTIDVGLGQEYTAITYNLGFGAYLPEFSFFMDGGKYSWAKSKESVLATISGASSLMEQYAPDFICLEEVDKDSTRSYHVDQNAIIRSFFSSYYETEAINYDSAFLCYPLTQPHGKSLSELAFLSAYPIKSGMRRSLPISSTVSKIVDLDRCYSVSRVPVENGKEICFYTVHLSAYGMDAAVREGQVGMLREDMEQELAKGNYIICGGDFNHDLKAPEEEPGIVEWARPFSRGNLAQGMHFAIDEFTREEIVQMHNSGRNTDMPYEEGITYTVMLDGFMVSDNVTVTSYEVVNTGYRYSDHEPVVMKFVLNP